MWSAMQQQLYDRQQTTGTAQQRDPSETGPPLSYTAKLGRRGGRPRRNPSQKGHHRAPYVNRRPPTRIPFRPPPYPPLEGGRSARPHRGSHHGNHNMAQGGRDRIPDNMSNFWVGAVITNTRRPRAGGQAAERWWATPPLRGAGSWNVDALWGYRSRPLAHS